jgi:glycine/D-amino acid oxidase-like deaminating enzyme
MNDRRVVRIDAGNDRVRVRTRHGVMEAKRVIIATGYATAYGGKGMTSGFLAARLLLEQWQGVKSSDHALFRFDRPAKR